MRVCYIRDFVGIGRWLLDALAGVMGCSGAAAAALWWCVLGTDFDAYRRKKEDEKNSRR